MSSLAKPLHISESRLVGTLIGSIFAAFVATFVWFLFMPPACSFVRAREKLPTAIVEDRHTVYCRMRYCDFRFLLPSDSVVETFNKVSGGSDTIDGSLRITTASGLPLDLRAYIQLLQRHGYHAETADGASLSANSTKPPGGFIEATLNSATTATIRFGYFGDF